jgi:hypothetical protein
MAHAPFEPVGPVRGLPAPVVNDANHLTHASAGAPREGRLFPPAVGVSFAHIPAIAIEYGDTGQPWQTIGTVLDWTIWLAFVVEFVVMLWVVPDRWLWIRKNPLDLAIVVLTPALLVRKPAGREGVPVVLAGAAGRGRCAGAPPAFHDSNRVSKRIEHSAHPGPWGCGPGGRGFESRRSPSITACNRCLAYSGGTF